MTESVRELISKLYEENYRNFVEIAEYHLKDGHRAEEIVQQVFEIGLVNYEKLSSSKNPVGWLGRTMMNLIKHEFRDRKYFMSLQQELCKSTELSTYNPEMTGERPMIFSVLSQDEYDLLELIYEKGYSIRDAAKVYGIEFEACKKRVYRARKKLINYSKKEKSP